MSNIRWIRAQELIERWDIGHLKIIDLISKSKITAYTEDGNEVDSKKPIDWKVGWGSAESRIQKLCFLKEEVEFYEKKYFKVDQKTSLKKEKRLRPSQQHRLEVRKIAASRWKDDLSLTIIDIANDDEVNTIAIKKDNNNYADTTIRKWIKDLCPNRNPGARPKKK